jgi:hypothetical protein
MMTIRPTSFPFSDMVGLVSLRMSRSRLSPTAAQSLPEFPGTGKDSLARVGVIDRSIREVPRAGRQMPARASGRPDGPDLPRGRRGIRRAPRPLLGPPAGDDELGSLRPPRPRRETGGESSQPPPGVGELVSSSIHGAEAPARRPDPARCPTRVRGATRLTQCGMARLLGIRLAF